MQIDILRERLHDARLYQLAESVLNRDILPQAGDRHPVQVTEALTSNHRRNIPWFEDLRLLGHPNAAKAGHRANRVSQNHHAILPASVLSFGESPAQFRMYSSTPKEFAETRAAFSKAGPPVPVIFTLVERSSAIDSRVVDGFRQS